jgi:hypothetical protein
VTLLHEADFCGPGKAFARPYLDGETDPFPPNISRAWKIITEALQTFVRLPRERYLHCHLPLTVLLVGIQFQFSLVRFTVFPYDSTDDSTCP